MLSDTDEIAGSEAAAPTPKSRTEKSLRHRIMAAAKGLAPYARTHRRHMTAAVASSVAVAAGRLALPWPIRGIIDLTIPGTGRTGVLATGHSRGATMAWLVGGLVVLGIGIGLAEYRQRVAVARFTVGTVNGARVALLDRFLESSTPSDRGRHPGDVLTRAVGDTARLRVGFRGVLVHGLQHGTFVIGVFVVFLLLDARLGLSYLVGLVAAGVVAMVGTQRTAAVARHRRIRDSRLAGRVLELATDPEAVAKTSDPDRPRTGTEITRIKGRTSAAVQGLLGVSACAVLLMAVRLESAQELATGDLVVVGSYLIMLHHPVIRLGRQVTRLGPQIISAERLTRLPKRTRGLREETVSEDDSIEGEMDAGAVTEVARSGIRTVAEEIGLTSTAKLASVGKAVGLHAFATELPEGYHTPIGKDGVPLSSMQLARLDAARRMVAGADRSRASAALPSAASGAAVPHDPMLPSLGDMLDPEKMSPLLGRLLDAPTPDVRVRSVRYKPGTNVVVHYDVNSPRGWAEAVAYASAQRDLRIKLDRRRIFKLVDRAGRRGKAPSADPLTWVAEIEALVQWLPLDLRIPVLSDGAAKLARRLQRVGLTIEDDTAKPKLLRYWPRRRAVLRVGDHIVKAYRDPDDFAAAAAGLQAAQALRHVETAAFEAVLPDLQATVQARLRGSLPSLPPRASQPAGEVLAQMHAENPLPVPAVGTDDLLAKAAKRAALICHLLPRLTDDVEMLLAQLSARRPTAVPPVTSHGNFHAGQLFKTKTGLAVIDVDRLCLAHPGYDLASYAAHVAFGSTTDDELIVATLDSLVAGYGQRPEGLNWFLAMCLLRRASVPFRYLDDRWPEATAALVSSAKAALER